MPEVLSKRDRMAMDRTPMPVREPGSRSADFAEVNLGYTSGLAVLEASRCLDCNRPVCIDGCPVGIRIDGFVDAIAGNDFVTASEIIHEDNALPGVCGRVCPQESQCEGSCVLAKKGKPIAIGHLERFIADWERQRAISAAPEAKSTGRRVAVVGSGPAGLACAGDLASAGHEVTVFEALHEPGGVLVYGIPEFRLPKESVRSEIEGLERLGVVFETDVLVGKGPTVETLFTEDDFDAVFIGTGAGLPRFPGIPGEDLIGVYSANEFLTRVNLMGSYQQGSETPVYDLAGRPVAVIGGGNTALDAARTALRLGGEPVTIYYRRTAEEMPARREEVEHAMEEGVEFRFLESPTRFGGEDGWLHWIEVQSMELGPEGSDGRRRPIPIEGALETHRADVVIIAIGNTPNPLLVEATPELETGDRSTIVVDPQTGATSVPGVFAGGDITTGGATVILAMAAGRRAASAINDYLNGSAPPINTQPAEPATTEICAQ